MFNHVIILVTITVVVVATGGLQGGDDDPSSLLSSNDIIGDTGTLKRPLVPHLTDLTKETDGDEEGNKNKSVNMIIGRPETVTVLSEGRTWDSDRLKDTDIAPGKLMTKEEERKRRRKERKKEEKRYKRPHRWKKNRKNRERRRKWRNRKGRKYYSGNRTYRRGVRNGGGGGVQNQEQQPPNNQRPGWVAANGSRRSLDPRRPTVRKHLVRQHNLLRAQVHPPAADMLAVKWYKTAAEQAQAWARQCDSHSHPDHPSVRWTSSYGACGQNVFVSPTKKRWSQVLRHWWASSKNFKYDQENNNTEVAAYTQMAWYNSHQLGCGFSQCYTPGGTTFFRYVCNYCPAGNDPTRLSRPYTQGSRCSLCPESCASLCPRSRRSCSLCTNACTYSDLWVNCAALGQQWHEWLCNTKTSQGVERFRNCRATCQCIKEIT